MTAFIFTDGPALVSPKTGPIPGYSRPHFDIVMIDRSIIRQIRSRTGTIGPRGAYVSLSNLGIVLDP
jgi:hypothetical protein